MTAVEPTTTPTNTPTTGTRSRRDVLCGLMVALVAPGALVAACSDSGSGGGGTTTTGGGATPTGGGLIVDNPAGGKILLARTGDEVKAYNAACTHMGTILDAPKDGISVCSNHGSEFSTEDGSVQKGPATQPLPAIDVRVEGDQVVLA